MYLLLAAAAPAAADTPHPLADAVRLTLLVLACLLGLLVLRFAVLRLTSAHGSKERESSGWGLLSYAAFIGVTVYDGFQRFGQPLSPIRTPLLVIAVIGGILGGLVGRNAFARLRWPGSKRTDGS